MRRTGVGKQDVRRSRLVGEEEVWGGGTERVRGVGVGSAGPAPPTECWSRLCATAMHAPRLSSSYEANLFCPGQKRAYSSSCPTPPSSRIAHERQSTPCNHRRWDCWPGSARAASLTGVRVTVPDKSRGLGGRTSTRRGEGWARDHGAQYFSAPPDFTEELAAWQAAGWAPWPARSPCSTATAAAACTGEEARFVGTPRMTAPARHLARGLTCACS